MFNVNRQITFELTNRCNARCPLCPRTGKEQGGISKVVSKPGFMDISLDLVTELCKGPTKEFVYCGNYGDPIAHPKAMSIFKIVSTYGIPQHINTNGSIQSISWWSTLGSLPNTKVTFALDGLEDTHSIYRINTNFNKILDNAKAYIEAGGEAIWMFIVFEHNQYQIEEARAIAKDIGFSEFKIKISSREIATAFDKGAKDLTKITGLSGSYRKTRTSDVQNIVIKAPTVTKYQSCGKLNGIETEPIKCYALAGQKMYVSPDGYLIPCCGTHSDLHRHNFNLRARPMSFVMFLNECDIKYDLNKYTMSEILQSYNDNLDILEDYWSNRSIRICNEKCGSNIVTEVISGDTRQKQNAVILKRE